MLKLFLLTEKQESKSAYVICKSKSNVDGSHMEFCFVQSMTEIHKENQLVRIIEFYVSSDLLQLHMVIVSTHDGL